MKSDLQKYGKIFLYISGIALIISLILLFILKDFSLPVLLGLGVTILGIATYFILDPKSVYKFLKGRQAKYGSNSLLMILSVFVILVVINLVGYKSNLRWDLTEGKQNTLSEETLATLKSLTEPIFVQAFFSNRISSETAIALLLNFQSFSNSQFQYELINPDADPVSATNAGIQRDGSIVVFYKDHQEILTSINEKELTSALIRLSQPGERAIYFLTGHGERNIITDSEYSYTFAYAELNAKNYQVNELNLLSTNRIPEDALTIIIAGPQKPLSQSEVDLLTNFLSSGGSLVVLYDPSLLNQFLNLEDPLADYLNNEWGLIFNDDLVIDQSADPITVSVATNYGDHPITDGLNGMVSVLPSARSIRINSNSSKNFQILATTSEQSWGEKNLKDLENNATEFNIDSDSPGPVSLAVAIEDGVSGSRIVAFGDSDFADDSFYTYYANADLFVNSIDWASNQDSLIDLTPRTQTTRLLVAPRVGILNTIQLGSIIGIPGLIIVAAIAIFVKRKREI
ncbi:MAG: GldG family protein [Anaerolineaceae bacterium]|nr:GldG family protein [Anaerolineaceae bacterium]